MNSIILGTENMKLGTDQLKWNHDTLGIHFCHTKCSSLKAFQLSGGYVLWLAFAKVFFFTWMAPSIKFFMNLPAIHLKLEFCPLVITPHVAMMPVSCYQFQSIPSMQLQLHLNLYLNTTRAANVNNSPLSGVLGLVSLLLYSWIDWVSCSDR